MPRAVRKVVRTSKAPFSAKASSQPPTTPDKRRASSDVVAEVVRELALGKSYLELGYRGDWSLSAMAAAVDGGAKRVRCVMPWRPEGLSTAQLTGRIAALGRVAESPLFEGKPVVDPVAQWFSVANLYHRDALNRIGQWDIVMLGDQIFHAEEPERLLMRAARLAGSHLIVSTSIMAPDSEVQHKMRVALSDGDMLFAGAMSVEQVRFIDAYWTERGVELEQYRRWPNGFTRREKPDFGVWWWFFTPGAVSNLLASVGFRTTEVLDLWDGRFKAFVAERVRP